MMDMMMYNDPKTGTRKDQMLLHSDGVWEHCREISLELLYQDLN